MGSDPSLTDAPDLQPVMGALEDADCRTIIEQLEEPMTAAEIEEACGIPTSTLYRKLDRLADASLVAEGTEIRADGHHATVYRVAFEEVLVDLDEAHSLQVAINRPAESREERLAAMWREVRKET